MTKVNRKAPVLHRTAIWLGIFVAMVLAAAFTACSDTADEPVQTPVGLPTSGVPTLSAPAAARPREQGTDGTALPTATPTVPAAPPPSMSGAATMAETTTLLPTGTTIPQTVTSAASAPSPAATPTIGPPAPSPIPPAAPSTPSTVPASPTPSPALPDRAAAHDELESASERAFHLVKELVAQLGRRESATAEELRAAELLKGRFEEMGYAAQILPFSTWRFDFARWFWSSGENAAVVVESPRPIKFTGLPLTFSPSGATNSGPLITLDLSETGDLPDYGLEGKVVHVRTGDIKLDDLQGLQDQVSSLAAAAGAVAVVFSGKLGEPSTFLPLYGVESPIPALFLAKADGTQLEQLVTEEEEVIVSVEIEVESLKSRNVVAELKGTGNDVVVVGAHYDTVPDTEAGANDNTSGIGVVLTLAENLAGHRLPFTVQFVLFGAEELGLFGSVHYVSSLRDEELGRMRAMMNFDVVGTGPRLNLFGDDGLTELSLALSRALGVDAEIGSLPWGASSDHASFQQAGIPVLLFFGPNVSRIHTPADRLEFVQPELLGSAVVLAETLLRSPEFAR